MRMSRQAKAEGHDLIVQTGARLIRERGIEGTSVSDVMTAAGRTHGGFYRHFATKTALIEACLDSAFDQTLAVIADPPSADGRTGFEAFARFYLSDDHLQNPGMGCPAAALGSEIARAPAAVQAAFARGLARMTEAVAGHTGPDTGTATAEASARLSQLIGAVTLARATDAVTGQAIREAALVRLTGADPAAGA